MNHLTAPSDRPEQSAPRQSEREERGASAVEYGLLIAGIAALIVVAVFALGPIIRESFADTCDRIKSGSTASLSATCKS